MFAIERLLDPPLLVRTTNHEPTLHSLATSERKKSQLIAELAEDGLARTLGIGQKPDDLQTRVPGKLSKIQSDHSQTSSRLNITEDKSRFGEPSPDVTLQ